jgi:Tumour necrosis factor receptor stn_TNFRSF12A_TNFR domain
MLSTTVKRTMATALSGAAIAATIGVPAASASPIDAGGAPSAPSDVAILPPTPRSNVPAAAETAPDTGFDLSSAAIGAAGTGLLVVVLAAGGLAWRRPITRGHDPAGA